MDLLLLPILLLAGVLSTGWLAIAAIVISVITSVYSYTVAQKAAKSSQDGLLITKHDNNAGLPVVYGERIIGGVKVWKNVSKSSFLPASGRTVFGRGDPNDGVNVNWKAWTFLDRVDVLCEGPIEGLTDILVDNETYNSPRFRERNHAIYRGIFMDGSPGQGPLTELSAKYPEWHTSSVGNRVAYVNSRFRSGHYKSDGYDSYYQGEPNCEYRVKGKLIYDPRKDTLFGGTGSHSLADESTWEWSDNPALCLMDYLTQPYGRNLHHAELDMNTFIAAANSCDELVDIPGRIENDTGGNVIAYDPIRGEWIDVSTGEALPHYRPDQIGLTQKRLTCNAVISPDQSVLENVKTLLQSMRGSLPYSNGRYSLILEAPRASSMDIGPADIIGGITFGNGERSKRYNRVTVVFPNKNKTYKEDRVSWPKLGSQQYADFLAVDNGEELFYEVQLDGICDYYQAEDIAEFICRDSRQQLQCEVQIKSKGMMLQPGDVVGVTHPTPGWTDRYFRVRQISISSEHTATLSLQEYNASTYDWADTVNEPDVPDVNLPLPSDGLLPVTDLQATISAKESAKGIPQGFVELSWIAPEGSVVREYITRITGVEDPSIKFEVLSPPTEDLTTERCGCAFTVPKDNMSYNITVAYMTTKDKKGPTTGGAITVPQYVTQIEQEQENLETEAGIILEREDGLGGFIPAKLTDLAQYYKDQEHDIDASLSTTNSTLTNQVTRLDSDIAQLQTQLGDITSGTASVYVQTTPPVAGVGGVPNPIPTNSRWYDSDDGNHPYVWNGSAWQSIKDGSIGQNTSRITTIEANLVTTDGNVAANATAVGVLETNVTNIDGVVTSQAGDITALQSTVNNPTTGVGALGTAMTALETTTIAQGNDISTNSTNITALQSTVTNPTTGVTANSGAISALDTRVTSSEGTITSQASDITALQSDVSNASSGVTANAGALSGLSTRVETVENDITSINVATQDITALSSDLQYRQNIEPEGTARPGDDNEIDLEDGSGEVGLEDDLSRIVDASSRANYKLATDIMVNEEGLRIQSEQIVDLTSTLKDAQGDILANAGATQALTTTVTSNGKDITAISSDVTSLTADLAATNSSVGGNATAISALTTEVSRVDDEVAINAADITSLDADLTTAEGDILANTNATDALKIRVSSAEGTLTSEAIKLTTLTSRVGTAESDISGNATAVSGLETRVTTAEGTITSEASKVTNLAADLAVTDGLVAGHTTSISANATAVSGLLTRVTAAEGTITSQSEDTTTLESNLTAAELDIAAIDGVVTGHTTSISANSTAVSGLLTRVTAAEGTITSQSQDITSLESNLTAAKLDITANAAATTALTTRVASAEGTLTSEAAKITDLQSDLTAAEGGISANAGATSGLTTRVTTAEGKITSQASDITTLTANLATTDGKADQAVSISNGAIAGVVTAEGEIDSLRANWYVQADINGRISGLDFNAGEKSSTFTVVADYFKVYNTNYGTDIAPFQVSGTGIAMTGDVSINGNLIVNGTITQSELGTGSVGSGEIINGSVGANELEISANPGGNGERMYFDGTNNRVVIYDSSNKIRVMLGKL